MDIAAQIEKFFTKAAIRVLRRRKIIWFAGILLLLPALFSAVFWGNYGNDIRTLFSEDSDAGKAFLSMQRSQAANTIVLEFDTGHPNGAAAIASWLDGLVEKIGKLHFVNSLTFRLSDFIAGASPEQLIKVIPQLYNAAILDAVDPKSAVASFIRQSAMPVPGVVSRLRGDPFGLSLNILTELEKLGELSGMDLSPGHAFLANRDASRAAVIIDLNPLKIGDAGSAREILGLLKEQWSDIPPGVKVNIISPLNHTIGNEETIKSDIVRISLLSVFLLGILFLLFYKGDFRAMWIPAVPVCASVMVAGVMALLFENISLFIIGVGCALLGLAVDQGIHVYTAFSGKFRVRRLGRIFLPMFLSTFTSACVFLMLVTSGIGAYVQLGIFASASLMISFLLAFFLLPTLQKDRPVKRFQCAEYSPTTFSSGIIISIWVGAVLFSAWLAKDLRKDFSLNVLDGTSAAVLDAEQDFERQWRKSSAPAMMVLTGKSVDEVAAESGKWRDLLKSRQIEAFVPSALWPAAETRQNNLATWQTPQTRQRMDYLESKLAETCRNHGLPESLFTPFFVEIRQAVMTPADVPPELIAAVLDRMIKKYPEWVSETILVRNTPENTSFLYDKAHGIDNCAIISRAAFNRMISADFYERFTRILITAAVVLTVLILPVFRSLVSFFTVMLPVFTAVLVLCGLLALFDMPLNIIICFSLILLTGLSVDYGVFALHNVRSKDTTSSIPSSMFLAAATSVLSTGAMLFSAHPIMFYTGFALSAGLVVSSICGLYVIPALCFLFRKSSTKLPVAALTGALLLFLTGCYSPDLTVQEHPERSMSAPQIKQELTTHLRTFSAARVFRLNATFQYYGYIFPLILIGKIGDRNAEISVIGVNPSGLKILEVSGSGGQTNRKEFSPAIPEFAAEKIFGGLYHDLKNIFGNIPEQRGLNVQRGQTPILLETHARFDDETVNWVFDGVPLRITLRRSGYFPRRHWLAVYRTWNDFRGEFAEIAYKNYNTGVGIVLRGIPNEKEIKP